jgi:hypothetical protein
MPYIEANFNQKIPVLPIQDLPSKAAFEKIQNLSTNTQTDPSVPGLSAITSIGNIGKALTSFVFADHFSVCSLVIKAVRLLQTLISLASFIFIASHVIQAIIITQSWSILTILNLFLCSHPVYLALILAVLAIDLAITLYEYIRENTYKNSLLFEAHSILMKTYDTLSLEDMQQFTDLLESHQETLSNELSPRLFQKYLTLFQKEKRTPFLTKNVFYFLLIT